MDEKQTAALREVFEALVSEWGWDLRREANDTNEYLLASTAAAWGGFLACYQHLAQWQPIETAPKDGTAIVIARIEDGTVYDLCNGHFEVVAGDEEDGAWDIRGGEPWCSYVGRSAGTYFATWLPGKEWESRWKVTQKFEYTHWMPLPAAPGALDQQKEKQQC
ncbi:DUF551 domain-containing protein [Ralstonia sp. 3PA37C10]|jgi:hypothetical protein|uniref:DUF551 domain-containing protein n=1 Tax=Ralstonia sp. 3PA37C10 TaxID=2502217 RepID=UPI0003FDBF23|nr:DUF551 domain-containing protein [Ralstonia sp. 3PA37C10]